jgi:hypothetical protein
VSLSFSRRDRGQSSAYGITTADGSHLDDVSRRQKQYAATMLFRVAAILVVVFVPGLSVMARVILGVVATVIPYFAVIRANGGPSQDADPTNLMIGAPRQPELPAPDRSITATRRAQDGEWFSGPAEDDDMTERQGYPE